jgi:hypothetical protein
MRVLLIQVDVSNLSEEEAEELAYTMSVQAEDINASILNQKIVEVEEEKMDESIH